jgi:RING finger/CHY zinc finger protein 1
VGGKDNYTHCNGCGICLTNAQFNNHECMNITESNCPICFDEIINSTNPVTILKCGHPMHRECMLNLLKTSFKCPMCSKAMVDITPWNMAMEAEILSTPMPDEYKEIMVDILCNECEHKSAVPFHLVGHKCPECGSYNTKKI